MKHFRAKFSIVVCVCLLLITMIGCSDSRASIKEERNNMGNDAYMNEQEMSPYAEAYSELCAGYDAINEYKEATDKLRESVGDEIAHSLVCCCLDFEDAGHYVTGAYFDDSAFDFYNTNYSILKNRYESLAEGAQKAGIESGGRTLSEYCYVSGSKSLSTAIEFESAAADENAEKPTAEETAQSRSMTAYVNGSEVKAEYEAIYAPKCMEKHGYYKIDWPDLAAADEYTVEMHIGDSVFTLKLN